MARLQGGDVQGSSTGGAEPTLPTPEKLAAVELLRNRLGHASEYTLLKLTDKVDGLNVSKADIKAKIARGGICEPCVVGRMTRGTRPASKSPKEVEKLARLHVDLLRPFRTESLVGNRYFMTVIDEATRFSAAIPLRRKSGAADALTNVVNHWERQTDSKVKRIRTDGGGEFVNKKLTNFMKQRGIIPEWTAPYSPESNGMAERTNRTLLEKMRTLMAASGLPDSYWEEALYASNELRNMLPTADLLSTPYESFLGKRPNVSRLRTFGCLVYLHVPKETCKY